MTAEPFPQLRRHDKRGEKKGGGGKGRGNSNTHASPSATTEFPSRDFAWGHHRYSGWRAEGRGKGKKGGCGVRRRLRGRATVRRVCSPSIAFHNPFVHCAERKKKRRRPRVTRSGFYSGGNDLRSDGPLDRRHHRLGGGEKKQLNCQLKKSP